MLLTKPLIGSLICSGLLAIALYVVVQRLNDAKEVIQDLTTWQGEMVSTVRLASGNPKVTKDTAKAQVQALGISITDLKASIKRSNEAVDRLAEERARALDAADRERKLRAEAIQTAVDLSAELKASAAVAAENTDLEVRRVQDQVYEAGL